MKKYRALVPIVLVVLMVASWYMLASDAIKMESTYNNYLTQARKYAEDGITKYAIENYNMALEIKGEADVYVEVANYYKSQEKTNEYLAWCENFFESYPTEPKAYDCVLDAYLTQKDYESCYDILITAEKRNISTDFIKKTSNDIKYVFKLDFNTFENVGVYSNNFCAVQSKNAWGFVDRYGEQRIACKYTKVGAYTKTNFTSVVNTDGDAYYIDKSGSKVLVSKDKYKSFGLLVDGIIAAEKTDGKYTYVNNEFKVLFGDYDYASTMNNGIAAVKNGDQWQLINQDGKATSNTKFVDVKLDEKMIAFRNDRAFVSTTSGKYIMVDSKGKQVGKLEFEDAKIFASESPAAVKIDGKWCFIDAKGNLISDKKYDDARSYVNGLAAVCMSGKWGFVDEKENIVIEPQFFGAKDFNEKGSCFVQTGDKWQLLKLYRLNREG